MKILIELSGEESELLKKHFHKSPIELVRLKSQAILMREKGFKIEDIASSLLRDNRSISRWIRDFSFKRMSSIFTGNKDNENASKLTRIQKQEVKEVLSNSPREYGLPYEFWDIPQLKKYIKVRFGVVYESDKSYYYILKFSSLSFKYADKFDIHRDELFIKQRIKEIKEEIEPYIKDPTWEVFASDEVGVQLSCLTRKAWLKKGESTVIKVDRSRKRQNYIGMLNQKTNKCDIYKISIGNQEEMIRTLRLLIKKYPKKKICIVWDNAAFHKGKLIREELKKNKSLQSIHLINFPPYAPDHNPVEHIWKFTKDKLFKMKNDSFDDTKVNFLNIISRNIFTYKI